MFSKMNSTFDKSLIDNLLNDKEFYNKINEAKNNSKLSKVNDTIFNSNNSDIISDFVKLWNNYDKVSKENFIDNNSNKCILDVAHIFTIVLKAIFIGYTIYRIIYDDYPDQNSITISIIKYLFSFAFIIMTQFDSYDIIKVYNDIYVTLPKDISKITDEYTLNILLELEERDKIIKLQRIWNSNLFYKMLTGICWIIVMITNHLITPNIFLLTYIVACICLSGFITFVYVHQLNMLNTKQWMFRNKYCIFLNEPHLFIKVLHNNTNNINDDNNTNTINEEYKFNHSYNKTDKYNNIFDSYELQDRTNYGSIYSNEIGYTLKDCSFSTPTINEYEIKISKLKIVMEVNYCIVLSSLIITTIACKHNFYLIPLSLMFLNLFIPFTYPILIKINILLTQSLVMIFLLLKL